MATATLYTPEVLGLATSLADFPWDDSLPLMGEARSRSCGSSISLALSLDAEGRIDQIGLKSQACAIGQASAAIFARGAKGKSATDIESVRAQIESWLGGEGAMPEWPGLVTIASAQAYPARHGAMMLAWRAASDILSRNGLRR